jgi:hypothetical protein
MLTALLSLPIVVDYCGQLFWNVTLQNCLTSTLIYPYHVYKIALLVTYKQQYDSQSMDFTFSILESLELHGISVPRLGQQWWQGLSSLFEKVMLTT